MRNSSRPSTRLTKLYKENVKGEEFENVLKPILARYVQERTRGERFGDWCDRVLLKEVAAVPAQAAAAVTAPSPAPAAAAVASN